MHSPYPYNPKETLVLYLVFKDMPDDLEPGRFVTYMLDRKEKNMTISKFRGWLYLIAKVLGDVQAVKKAAKTKSAKPIAKRFGRRIVGKATGRLIGRMFR